MVPRASVLLSRLPHATLLAMRTTGPTARSTRAFHELGAYSLDVRPACFGLLYGSHPANPFITRKRSDVLPGRVRPGRRQYRFSQIRRYCMQSSGRESFSAHSIVLVIDRGSCIRRKHSDRSQERGLELARWLPRDHYTRGDLASQARQKRLRVQGRSWRDAPVRSFVPGSCALV